MRIARRSIVLLAVLSACLVTKFAQADVLQITDDPNVANALVVTYDPMNGYVSTNGNGTVFTSFEIKSANNRLNPAGATEGIADGPFDVNNENKFFKLATGGLESLDIGMIAPASLSASEFIAEMTVDGSIKPSGRLPDAPGGGPYLYVVPEPSSLVLVFCGLLGLLGLRRK